MEWHIGNTYEIKLITGEIITLEHATPNENDKYIMFFISPLPDNDYSQSQYNFPYNNILYWKRVISKKEIPGK